MKKIDLLRIGILIIVLVSIGFAQGKPGDLSEKEKAAIADKNLEKDAREYMQAIIDEDVGKIFKYVHPDVVGKFGSKGVVIELLKVEFAAMKKEGLEPVSVELIREEMVELSDGTSYLTVVHKTKFKTPEESAEFGGELRVYRKGSKNYFIYGERMILLSLGIKEFNKDDDSEKPAPEKEPNKKKPGANEDLESQTARYLEAVRSEDIGKIMVFVHPKVIAEVGGESTFRKLLEARLKLLKKVSVTPSSTKLISIEKNDTSSQPFATIKHTSIFTYTGGQQEIDGVIWAFREKGKTYFIVPGWGVGHNLGLILPDAPKDRIPDPEKIDLGFSSSPFPVDSNIPSDFAITLERTVCLGKCPVYKVKVDSEGVVEFEGKLFVATVGKVKSKISKEEVFELIKAFKKAEYFKSKTFGRHLIDCAMETTDNPFAATSIQINRFKKTIRHNLACRAGSDDSKVHPAALYKLENKIDEIARTKRWIGDGKARNKK